jgi:nitrogen fixation protein FixH
VGIHVQGAAEYFFWIVAGAQGRRGNANECAQTCQRNRHRAIEHEVVSVELQLYPDWHGVAAKAPHQGTWITENAAFRSADA